ncbi:MAG: RAD52 family DNA repair protein [Acidobacteria bacterium]|nr:RAD52 family DNA repair protein [Acidobacteriota bacterium]
MNGNAKINDAVKVSETFVNPPDSSQSAVANSHQNSMTDTSFAALLKQLSEGIKKEDIKQREGWRDRNGKTHFVDYVEWHTVADLLDKLVPKWSHRVRRIIQIGQFVAATASITINGVTREGIGTGSADSETGIKKAEHDALKRAAVKFGIARDLYREEDKVGERSNRSDREARATFPSNPIAQTVDELVSLKQLNLIRRLAENLKFNPEDVCHELYRARLEEISRKAASALIDHLNAMSSSSENRSSNYSQGERKRG